MTIIRYPDGEIDGAGRVFLNNPPINGALTYLTQAAWAVNAATGNDGNDGSPAHPLKTPGELTRRLEGRVYSPTVTAITIDYDGDWSGQSLVLSCAFVAPCQISITGHTTVVKAGVVTGFTDMNPAGGIRAAVTDATADFTLNKQQWIRLTSGASIGALTKLMSLSGGITTANVGQFYSKGTPANFWTGAVATPVVNDDYVIETISTKFSNHRINFVGPVVCQVSRIAFVGVPLADPNLPAGVTNDSSSGNCGALIFYGCDYDYSQSGMASWGKFFNMACGFSGAPFAYSYGAGRYNEYACIFFGPSIVAENCSCNGKYNMHDGDGIRNVSRSADGSAIAVDLDHRGFFGNVNGSAASNVQLTDGAIYNCETANALLWGALGNTVTQALRVYNSCGMIYTTKPTMTGTIPGNDVVLAAAAPIPWAAIPATSAAPDNAYIAVRH